MNTNGEVQDQKDDGSKKKQAEGVVMKVSPLLDIEIPVTSVEAITQVIIFLYIYLLINFAGFKKWQNSLKKALLY